MFIFAKVYFLLTASYACSTGFESTYEELKRGPVIGIRNANGVLSLPMRN